MNSAEISGGCLGLSVDVQVNEGEITQCQGILPSYLVFLTGCIPAD